MNEKQLRYDKFFSETAKLSAKMSFCERRKVGAILTKDTRIISNGWNGTVSGEDNCCEEDFGEVSDIEHRFLNIIKENDFENEAKEYCSEYGLIFESIKKEDKKYKLKYRRPKIRTKNSVVHAEANAIAYAAKEGISTKGCSLYVTLSPCINCANLIIQAGIKEVIYTESYRDTSGIDHLKKNNIAVKYLS